MTKYTDNAQYEKDKANFTNLVGYSIIINNRTLTDLLKQSKWIGTVDDSAAIRPIPVVKDKYGRLIKGYDVRDWLIAINEKYKEVTRQIILEDNSLAAERLQELKHVCTTMQHWLGFDDKAIDELCADTNAKNQRRGYFEI